MKIQREIDGKTYKFELTNLEMAATYYEQQHKWDVEYMLNMADMCERDEWYEKLKFDPDFASRVAFKYREYIEDTYCNGDMELACFIDAFDYMERNQGI